MTDLIVRTPGRRSPLPAILNMPTLLLNADYRPLSTEPPSVYTVRWGLEEVHNDRVILVEAWPQVVVRTAKSEYPAPRVVALKDWVDVHGEPRFCRKNVFLRDRYRCQYCGERFPSSELTWDHVFPKSLGGPTVWDNVVAACIRCNGIKRDSLANYSAKKRVAVAGQMRPLKPAKRPTAAELYRAGLEVMPCGHMKTFADYLYWGVDLTG